MYQTEWHNIRFADFTELSARELAGPEFYRLFYEEFFRRYRGWDDLSPEWVSEKRGCAEFIASRLWDGARVLSVGCGLGIMEHRVREIRPSLALYIHELAPTAWRWIEHEFSDDRKLLGPIPQILPAGARFDLVYLCAVDYALDDVLLVRLLSDIRPFLADAGSCLIVSASYYDRTATWADDAMRLLLRAVKSSMSAILDAAGLRRRSHGQFWGWNRTRDEYRALMRSAGYAAVHDGFMETSVLRHYWIAGR